MSEVETASVEGGETTSISAAGGTITSGVTSAVIWIVVAGVAAFLALATFASTFEATGVGLETLVAFTDLAAGALGLATGFAVFTGLVAVFATAFAVFTTGLALGAGFTAALTDFFGAVFFTGMMFLTVLLTTFVIVFIDFTVFLATEVFATRGGFFVATDLAFLFGFGEIFLVIVLTDLPGDPSNAVTNSRILQLYTVLDEKAGRKPTYC